MNHLLRIQCSDRVGLVYQITGILSNHSLNITEMREFVDNDANQFFTRISCEGTLVDESALYHELKQHLPEGAIITINPKKEKKIVVMVTKEYHCLGDTLVRHFFNSLGAKVCGVIGNYADLGEFTEKFDIPFHHISHLEKSKEQFEAEVIQVIEGYEPDYVILAKFMRILSPEFNSRFPERIINIHHSFLPAFIGASPYRRAFERGVKLIGATAHFVTNDLDEGPIIEQQTIPVNHTFGVTEMVTSGKEIEKAVLSRAMQLVFEDRVFITGNKTVVFE
ncbi:formyltetrahydrofolate deformylase [Mucilaginibacter yixingensis]|uniref:Formyltetrahydrofolate deformylase n=1 Tax=Mucilaginibacter yixingensis TaxID=1295612 RepID=A0A2T5JFV3_9SPHI|nr:formyltetrahydrofolate deformylase [Mucilaginibacter yixingensis]PTR01312.1 formyltetrahydrofolate deformylase [Mucilaginibacter yixingensis]